MNVQTVTASVKYSRALGDGSHKTVELLAEATVEYAEAWQEAQAGLYQQLVHDQATFWGMER